MSKRESFKGFVDEIKGYLDNHPRLKKESKSENKVEDLSFTETTTKIMLKQIKEDIINFLFDQRRFWLKKYGVDLSVVYEFIDEYHCYELDTSSKVALFRIKFDTLFKEIEYLIMEGCNIRVEDTILDYSHTLQRSYNILKDYHKLLTSKYQFLLRINDEGFFQSEGD